MPHNRPMVAPGARTTGTEHQEQAMLIQWAGLAAGREPALALLYAIPNGGQRHKAVAAKLKAEGAKAGVPDLCLPVSRGYYHALYIEMKVKPNTPTKGQLLWHDVLRAQDNRVEVCYSWESARDALVNYLALAGSASWSARGDEE